MLGEVANSINLNHSIYSNVQNYDAICMTPYFNNKSHENHHFFMRKVTHVFSSDDLVKFVQFCENSHPVDIQERRTDDHVSREYLFRRNVCFFPVNFNEQGVPSVDFSGANTPSRILNSQLQFPEAIDKCILLGLERFGKEMGWKKVTKEIACNVVRSKLPAQEEITLLDWHSDFNTDHSFVITLDNPQGKERGWSGGLFCFGAEAVPDYSMREIFGNNLSASRDSRYPTWTMSIDQNEAVLFSNKGTNHFISPMKAYSSDNGLVNRHILTFFEGIDQSNTFAKDMDKAQFAFELSESLQAILTLTLLPSIIQEQVNQHLISLKELTVTINRYKSKIHPKNFYNSIQEAKLKIHHIAESLESLISQCDGKISRQVKEKILEWIYNS